MKKSTNSYNNKSLSREDIQLYAAGKLQGEKLRLTEELIAENGLEAEAIEGILSDPEALNILPENPAFIQQKKGRSIYGVVVAGIMLTAILSTTALLIILFSITGNDENNKMNTAKNEEYNQKISIPDQTPEQQIKEIEDAEPLEIAEQITYEKTKRDQPVTKQLLQAESSVEYEIEPEIKPEAISEKKSQPIQTITENKVEYSNVRFKYIVDLKVIDYSNLYTSSIPTQKIENQLTGLSANYENEDSRLAIEPEIRTVQIPYEDYLKETLDFFKRNDYKAALKNFRIIHKHYPEDLNAYFYGGLCYYNLNKCTKAIVYFDKCLTGSFNTFYEEAEWYKALSLLRCNKKEDAFQSLQTISNGNGFYNKKAQELLEDEKGKI